MWRRAVSAIVMLALVTEPVLARKQLKDANDARQGTNFDFFFLVRQWPGTFCATHSCPLLKHRDWDRFTIHGLWPNRFDGTWPEFCSHDQPFDEEAIADLRPDLEEVWPSFMDDHDSFNFWAHEWNKHGTCSLGELPSEHDFFKAVLKLNSQYDLRSALERAGITPSAQRTYDKTAVVGAIRSAYGVNTLIHCDSNGKLTEVWMCFDKDLGPLSCRPERGDASRCATLIIDPIPGGHSASTTMASGDDMTAVRDADVDSEEWTDPTVLADQAAQEVERAVEEAAEQDDDDMALAAQALLVDQWEQEGRVGEPDMTSAADAHDGEEGEEEQEEGAAGQPIEDRAWEAEVEVPGQEGAQQKAPCRKHRASSSAAVNSVAGAGSSSVVSAHRRSHVGHAQSSEVARTVSIAAAAGMLACVLAVTVLVSVVRRVHGYSATHPGASPAHPQTVPVPVVSTHATTEPDTLREPLLTGTGLHA